MNTIRKVMNNSTIINTYLNTLEQSTHELNKIEP